MQIFDKNLLIWNKLNFQEKTLRVFCFDILGRDALFAQFPNLEMEIWVNSSPTGWV